MPVTSGDLTPATIPASLRPRPRTMKGRCPMRSSQFRPKASLLQAALLAIAAGSAPLAEAQFREPPALAVPGNAVRPVTGDFNGDGLVDVAVGYWVPYASGGIAVFPGTGAGSYGAPIVSPNLGNFGQAATADLNADGLTDFIAVDTSVIGGVNVFIADGAGSFLKTHFGPEPNADATEGVIVTFYGATLADVDGDTDLDILAVPKDAMGPFVVYVNINNGGGNFAGWTKYPFSGFGDAGEIAAGDVNGDGAVDVLIPNEKQGGGVGIFINNGSGAYSVGGYLVTLGDPSAGA